MADPEFIFPDTHHRHPSTSEGRDEFKKRLDEAHREVKADEKRKKQEAESAAKRLKEIKRLDIERFMCQFMGYSVSWNGHGRPVPSVRFEGIYPVPDSDSSAFMVFLDRFVFYLVPDAPGESVPKEWKTNYTVNVMSHLEYFYGPLGRGELSEDRYKGWQKLESFADLAELRKTMADH